VPVSLPTRTREYATGPLGPLGLGIDATRCHLVEVALPVNAGCVDELLVFGDTLGRLQILVKEGAEGAEVDVDDAVGLGQQACASGGALEPGTRRRPAGAQPRPQSTAFDACVYAYLRRKDPSGLTLTLPEQIAANLRAGPRLASESLLQIGVQWMLPPVTFNVLVQSAKPFS